MEDKKIGCVRKFDNENGKIIVGTFDKKNCTSCYVTLQTYITPEYKLHESVDRIRRRLKANMDIITKTYFEGDLSHYLISIDHNITKGKDKALKTSYIEFEVTLFAKDIFEFDKDFIYMVEQFGDTLFTLISTVDEMIIGKK